jgi:large subunit ribosomal protein L1
MEEKINKALKAALDSAPERKFTESVELAFTLRDVDLKVPTNRVQEEVRLPNGRGKDVKIAMFAAGDSASQAKKGDVHIIDPSTIEDLGGNKKTAKRLANEYDYFLSEVPHMGSVGRFLGVVLGPRGKMPRPVPPTVDPSMIAAGLRNTVVVRSRDKMTFHVAIGTVKQTEEELMENVMTVYNRVTSKLERGIGNIRSLYIKTSMGPSVAVEVIN